LRRLAEQARASERAARALVDDVFNSGADAFRVPTLIGHPLLLGLLAGIAGLLGLFLMSQLLQIIATLALLPSWAIYAGVFGIAVLLGMLAYSAGQLTITFWRLRPNQPVRVEVLEEISHRIHLRALAANQSVPGAMVQQTFQLRRSQAKSQLESYLKDYPIGNGTDDLALQLLGMTKEALERVTRSRESLCDANCFAGIDDWLATFRREFQKPLDEVAVQRVGHYARRVAVTTAASPNPLVDTVVTCYGGFSMLTDLCRIYNLRADWFGMTVLLARVFANAYLAGQLNQAEAHAEAGIQHAVDQSGAVHTLLQQSGLHHLLAQHVVSPDTLALEAATGKVVGKVGARAASGLLNYFMMRRLGSYAIRLLQPIDPN
jgi:uncharacterized membrane protein YcjF (UPF0283 family)